MPYAQGAYEIMNIYICISSQLTCAIFEIFSHAYHNTWHQGTIILL